MLKTSFEIASVSQKESTLPCSRLTGSGLTTRGISSPILNNDRASSYRSRSGGMGKGSNEGAAKVGSGFRSAAIDGAAVGDSDAVGVCAPVGDAVGGTAAVGVRFSDSEVGVGVEVEDLPVSQPTSRIEAATTNNRTRFRVVYPHEGRSILPTGQRLFGVNFRGCLRLILGEVHRRRR